MARTIQSTPKKDGFRMPGEFEPHEQTWLIWPERTDIWYYGGKPAQDAYVELVDALIEAGEEVTLCVSYEQYANARARVSDKARVIEVSTDDAWARDMGPTFVKNDQGEVRSVDWFFNAWGGLEDGSYFPWDRDDTFAQRVSEIERIDRYDAPFVLEGGSIHVDGEGTLIATEECLLHPNRNPHLSREELTEQLKEYLNLEKIIWIKEGLYGDGDTNGHVDNLLFFARPGEVVLTWTNDESDPQYHISRNALAILENSTDAKGRKLKVHKLITPVLYYKEEEIKGLDSMEVTYDREERIPASYANCYIANDAVVLPVFGCNTDDLAIQQVQGIFPERKVIPVQARSLVCAGGDVHCLTQQQPK